MKVFIFVLIGILTDFCSSSPINEVKTINYRLNTDVEPLDYIIDVTPNFDRNVNGKEPFSFDGICTITIKVRQSNVNTITLHKQDLDIVEQSLTRKQALNVKFPEEVKIIDIKSNNYNNETNKYTLKLASTLVKDEHYVLNFKYNAKLRTDLYGFYRSSYRDGNITK